MKKKILSVFFTTALVVSLAFVPMASELSAPIEDELIIDDGGVIPEEPVVTPETGDDNEQVTKPNEEIVSDTVQEPLEPDERESDLDETVEDTYEDLGDFSGDSNGLLVDDSPIVVSDEDIVADEPDNAIDGEDEYYEPEYDEALYTDEPFDASYITGSGAERVKDVIMAYANSLGGTFRSPYYKNGKAVSIQCCAYANQVWKHVFGKDIYDGGISTTNSREGETCYHFLERTGAKVGDILYVRYWKVSKNKWSSHFMIVLGYDETGVYVTDGYETDAGEFLVWRINKKAFYDQSNFFKRSGSDKDKPDSTHFSGKKGSFFKLYRISQQEWCNVAESDYSYTFDTDLTVTNVSARTNLPEDTFVLSTIIYAKNGIDKVDFSTWTVANGRDDFETISTDDEGFDGYIEDIGDDMYLVKCTVSIENHNFEVGNYFTELAVTDNEGVLIEETGRMVNMDGAANGVCVDYIAWSLN